MTLEQLRDADLAMSPRAEILARLGQPSSASAELVRELDELVDQYERDRSTRWSQPLSGNAEYHAQVFAALSLASEGMGLLKGGASMTGGWQGLVDSCFLYIQGHRRLRLWDQPLPEYLSRTERG